MYAIKDVKVNSFTRPFFHQHDALAVREFDSLVNDEKTQFNTYPAEFELWKIGTINQVTSELKNDKKMIIQATSVLKENNNVN